MKKPAAALIAVLLLLCFAGLCFGAPAPEEPPEDPPAEPAVTYEAGYYQLAARTPLYDAPDGEALLTLPKGAVLRVTETDENGFGAAQWDGAEGWLPLGNGIYRAPFSDENGEIGLVIDLSRFNPPEGLDWEKLKAAGVTGVILRTGGRFVLSKEIYDDTAFAAHYENAAAAGLPVGVYFFSFAMTPEGAKEEANYVLDVLRTNGCSLGMPVFIDIEGYNNDTQHVRLGKAGCSDVTAVFCDTVLDAGYCPGICTYTNFAELLLDENLYTPDRAVWMADYRPEGCGFAGRYDLWQFTGSGRLPGAAYEVDLSLCYTDFPALIASYGSGCETGNHRPCSAWEVTDPGICTGEGTRVKKCIDCGETALTETFPGTEHDWELISTAPSTCIQAGEETYVCKNDASHVKTEPLPLAEHRFLPWVELKPATFTEPGLEGRACEVCAAVETRATPVLPRPEVDPGDVNGDGEIKADDARLALRAAVRLETFTAADAAFLAADTDGDGKITAADARRILRAAVKLEDPKTW